MDLLYVNEHFSCFQYDNGYRPGVETFEVKEGCDWNTITVDNKIIFVSRGEFIFSFGEYSDQVVSEGKIVFVPAGCEFTGSAKEGDVSITVFRIHANAKLCDQFPIEKLFKDVEEDVTTADLFFLESNEILNGFLSTLNLYMNDGLKCRCFFDIKIKELLLLFRGYYPKTDLANFFGPLVSNDTKFSDFVVKNHLQVKTVKELAAMSTYSLSGFEKRFKKVFGVSAYQWMKEQRAKLIFREINSHKKTFKEISYEYGFYSPAHFNDFCRTQFGSTPGQMRKVKQECSC